MTSGGISPARRRRPRPTRELALFWLPFVVVAAAGAFLLWSRFAPIQISLWQDEIDSVLHYVNPGPSGIWGPYTANDHQLFELLAWVTVNVTGSHSEAAYRIWGVLPGIGSVAVLMWWLWRRLGRWVGAVFAALAVTAPLQMQLSIEARGYGLVFLSSALMLVAADWYARTASRRALALFGGGALIGIWTVPSAVLPFLSLAGLLCLRSPLRKRTLITVALVGLASLAYYAPDLSAVVAGTKYYSTPSRLVGRLPWDGFVSEPLKVLVGQSIQLVLLRLSTTVAALLGGVLVVTGVLRLRARSEGYLALMTTVPTLVAYAAIEAARYRADQRFGGGLVLLQLLVPCAFAIVELGRAVSRRSPAIAALAGPAFALLMLAAGVRHFNRVTGVPVENWKGAAALARATGFRQVLIDDKYHAYFDYYEQRAERLSDTRLEAVFCSNIAPFVYVERYRPRTPSASTDCLARRDAAKQRPPSQNPITVWVVSEPRSGQSPLVWCPAVVRPIASPPPPLRTIASGEPVVVSPPGSAAQTRLTLTVSAAQLTPAVAGVGAAAGRTFEAGSRFIGVQYAIANAGRKAIQIQRVSSLFAVSGLSGVTIADVGSGDPGCTAATASYAASRHLGSPDGQVAPGKTVTAVSLYALPHGLATGPGELSQLGLAWSSATLRLTLPLTSLLLR